MSQTPSKRSMEVAAGCWCEPETKNVEMDTRFAVAAARMLDRELQQERASILAAIKSMDWGRSTEAHDTVERIAETIEGRGNPQTLVDAARAILEDCNANVHLPDGSIPDELLDNLREAVSRA